MRPTGGINLVVASKIGGGGGLESIKRVVVMC